MQSEPPAPLLVPDNDARAIAGRLLADARTAALAFRHPDTGHPFISRIAVTATDQGILTLVSDLSLHSRALKASPDAALLIGEAGARGDSLTHPRLSLSIQADTCPEDARPALRAIWLSHHPKAKLYVDFSDFRFLRLTISGAMLNAGFARAYALTADDIALP